MLIHGATFDDALADDARAERHSTVGEAVRMGRAMRAECPVLTHFSQRYPKVAGGTEAGAGVGTGTGAGAVDGSEGLPPSCRVVAAYDFMRLGMRQAAGLDAAAVGALAFALCAGDDEGAAS